MERRYFIKKTSIITLGAASGLRSFSFPTSEDVLFRRFLFRLAAKLLFDWASDSITDNYEEKNNEYNPQVHDSVARENLSLNSDGYKPHSERKSEKKSVYKGFYYDETDRDFFYPMYKNGFDVSDYRVPFFSIRPQNYGHCTTLLTPEVGALSSLCELLGQYHACNLFKPLVYPRNMFKRKSRRNNQKNGSAVLYFTDWGEIAVSYSRGRPGKWNTQIDYLPFDVSRSSKNLRYKPLSESFYLDY